MLKHRVIPALLLQNKGLVKTTRFKDPCYVGDPLNVIRIFNEKEVDELMVIDIMASRQNRDPDYDLVQQIAGECFMPLSYGGGIQTVEQARRLFSLGIEKICLQTAVLNNPNLISDLANEFGSQSVMVSVDIKKNWFGQPKLYQSATRNLIDTPWIDKLCEFVSAGAGEILLNAVDKDGMMNGPELSLVHQASAKVDVPVIALGGVSSLADIKACVDAGASAVAAGAFFVYHGPHRAVLITYPKYRELERLFEGSL